VRGSIYLCFGLDQIIATTEDCYETIFSIIPLISIVSLVGCELVGDIFKAGVWVGVILVIGIIGLVIWMFSKAGS
jgi:hypothetical protein